MRPYVLALALLALLPSAGAVAEQETPVIVAERAPSIALGDQHGRPFRLDETLAQRDFVIVAFFVKAFTGG